MQTSRPRMEHCEPRRLLAFVGTGASTINGQEFQSIDRIVDVDNGYVAAGLFSKDTNFGNGKILSPLGESDIYLALVRDGKTTILTLGGESRLKMRFNDDRIDFAARPRRNSEDFQFGISADPRRADEYVSQMKLGPDGKLYVSIHFRKTLRLDSLNPRSKTLVATGGYEDDFYDSAILRYDLSSGRFALDQTIQIGGPFNDLIQDFAFDAAGNLIATGSFERNTDFDPTSGTAIYSPLGRGDTFVAKYSTDGKLIWVSQFGGDSAKQTEIESGYGIDVIQGTGQIVVGGSFADRADFARNGVVTRRVVRADDLTDGYTMLLNADGYLQWVAVQGGEGYDAVRDVVVSGVNGENGIMNVGYFELEADLDPTSTTQRFEVNKRDRGSTDLFITNLALDASLNWVGQIAGNGFELVASAMTNVNGDLVIAGSYFGRADFDPSRRTAFRTTPESGIDDNNQSNRDNAYAGFVAVYGKSNGKFRGQTQINGRNEEDVFIVGASMSVTGDILVSGRYRDGFEVPGSTLSVKSRKPIDRRSREDGYTLVFRDDLTPIV